MAFGRNACSSWLFTLALLTLCILLLLPERGDTFLWRRRRRRRRQQPVWGPWTQWSYCSNDCSKPTTRSRTCISHCSQKKQVESKKCPCNNQWSPWSAWSSCSVSCGVGGQQTQTRQCHPVSNGCSGSSSKSRTCHVPPCSGYPSAALIRRYAPQVRLHSSEEYFLTSVDNYMKKSSMFYGASSSNGGYAKPVLGKVSMDTVNHFQNPANSQQTSGDKSVPGQFRLILNKEDRAHREGMKSGGAPVYFTVLNGKNYYEIKYIFFYAYNGPTSRVVSGLGAHEGDIEHISVRLRQGSNQLMGVYFSAHGSSESKWYNPNDLEYHNGHPVVYSAKFSHANYPKPGNYKRLSRNFGLFKLHFAADQCNSNGLKWNTWERVVNVGSYDKPFNNQYWVRYNGRWGRYKDKGCFGITIPLAGKQCLYHYPDENGPTNLARKGWFFKVQSGGPQ